MKNNSSSNNLSCEYRGTLFHRNLARGKHVSNESFWWGQLFNSSSISKDFLKSTKIYRMEFHCDDFSRLTGSLATFPPFSPPWIERIPSINRNKKKKKKKREKKEKKRKEKKLPVSRRIVSISDRTMRFMHNLCIFTRVSRFSHISFQPTLLHYRSSYCVQLAPSE